MRSSYDHSEIYHQTCEKVFTSYADFCQSVLLFRNAYQAITESTVSLAQTFSHKMSIAVVSGTGPYHSKLAIYFSRQGYNVQIISFDSVTENRQWVEELNKDTLFVFFERDQFFTAEIFRYEAYIQQLEEKKIFHLSLSHKSHFFAQLISVGDYGLRFCAMENDEVLALIGRRVKVQPLVAQFDTQGWNERNFLICKQRQDRENVIDLEKKISQAEGLTAYFLDDFECRLFDRLLFFTEDIDSSAVSEAVNSLRKKQDKPELKIQSASLCYWDCWDNFEWIGPKRYDNKKMKGLLYIPLAQHELDKTELIQLIAESRDLVLKSSLGEEI